MRRRLRAGYPLMLALLVALLSGCTAPWPFPQRTPDVKPPSAQQVLRPQLILDYHGDLQRLDPANISFGVDYGVAQLIFPQLLTLDERQQPLDWAAERHEVSADGLTYTFHLRKAMRWSDGAPIDATTFAWSINRTLDPCTGSKADVAFSLYSINGAQALHEAPCLTGSTASATTLIGSSLLVPDPLTLRIALNHPAGDFLAALTYSTSWAIPKQLIERYGEQWTDHLSDGGGFGGNLFKLTRWDHAGHLDLAINDTFWGQKPILQKIQYTLYKDTGIAWAAYKAGEGDTGYPLAQELDSARTLPGSVFQQAPLLSLSYLTLNWHVAPFDDARVRNAFSLALDRQAIATYTDTTATLNTYTLKGTMQPTIHLLPEGMPGYNPSLSNAAGESGETALAANVPAAQRLAQAYAAENCGGTFAQCVPIVLSYVVNRPSLLLALQAIYAQWVAAFPTWPLVICACEQHRLPPNPSTAQLLVSAWSADEPDPQNALSLRWMTSAPSNQTFVSLPEADRLLAQADAMSDLAARTALYQRAEQLLITQGAAIPYAQPLTTYVVRSRVVGWSIAPSGQTPLSVWQATYLTR